MTGLRIKRKPSKVNKRKTSRLPVRTNNEARRPQRLIDQYFTPSSASSISRDVPTREPSPPSSNSDPIAELTSEAPEYRRVLDPPLSTPVYASSITEEIGTIDTTSFQSLLPLYPRPESTDLSSSSPVRHSSPTPSKQAVTYAQASRVLPPGPASQKKIEQQYTTAQSGLLHKLSPPAASNLDQDDSQSPKKESFPEWRPVGGEDTPTFKAQSLEDDFSNSDDFTESDESEEESESSSIKSEDDHDEELYRLPATSDTRVAATAVYEVLTGNIGCTVGQHEHNHAIHVASGGDNHHDLSATYAGHSGVRTSRRPEVGLDSAGLPLNQEYPRHCYPDGNAMKVLFEGAVDGEHPIPRICLHMEPTPASQSHTSYDIDGFIGFPRTLGAFRNGFRWCPAQHMSFLIRDNLQVKRRIEFTDVTGRRVRRSLHLRDIPHLYLGSIDGLFQCALYVFFPNLVTTGDKFRHLKASTVKKFIDHALMPSCQQYLEPERLQRIPPTQEVAELKARAKGVEQQQVRGEKGLKTYISHALQSRGLSETWDCIMARCETELYGLSEFKGAFLLANAKNLKAEFKVSGSLYQTMDRYRRHLSSIFDFAQMDLMIHDLAREVYPMGPLRSLVYPYQNDQATCFLWRTCCLDSEHEKLKRGAFGGRPGQRCLYHPGFLNDAASMTVVPPKKSQAYQGGWLYAQWYAVVKVVGDAGAVYPFSHGDLTELAIDPRVWAAHVKRHKKGTLERREFLVNSYNGSKERVRTSYRQYQDTAFAIRTECRVVHSTFDEIMETAHIHENPSDPEEEPPVENVPTYVWPISTESWSRFMLGNYDKFMTALEVAAITSPTTGITLERSKLMATLIKCIQRFSSTQPSRDAILWYTVDDAPRGTVRGLGFKESMPSYGYGWFAPVVDWTQLIFASEVSSQMVRVDRRLHHWYQGSGRLLQDTSSVLDVCFGYLKDHHANTHLTSEAMLLSIHLCLREYRRDILTAIRKEFKSTPEDDIDIDLIRFCYDNLSEVLLHKPSLMTGNKSKFAAPDLLAEWVWGDSSEYNRTHFTHKPFRIMMQKVQDAVRGTRPELYREWQRLLKSEFMRYHWLIPYPDINGTLISTVKKTQARQWWSGIYTPKTQSWSWGRAKFISGNPPPYPITLTMDLDNVHLHFQNLLKGVNS